MKSIKNMLICLVGVFIIVVSLNKSYGEDQKFLQLVRDASCNTIVKNTTNSAIYGFKLVSWGNNNNNQTNVPDSIQGYCVVQAVGGQWHSMALTTGGSVVAWGGNLYGQTNVPPEAQSGVMEISACYDYSMALTTGGVVAAWGAGDHTNVPPEIQGKVCAIGAGHHHALALTTGGIIKAWGNNSSGQTNVPPNAQSGIKKIAAGYYHNLALTTGGNVIAWGYNIDGQTNVPPLLATGGVVVGIAAGKTHSMALTTNGEVFVWGNSNLINVPLQAKTGIIDIAAGENYCLALSTGGYIIAWGSDMYTPTNVPAFIQGYVVDIAGGYQHAFALVCGTGYAQIVGGNIIVSEDIGCVTVSVERAGGWLGDAGVGFETVDLTASSGVDYYATNGLLNWGDKERGCKQVPIRIINRNGVAGNRAFKVQLSNLVGGMQFGGCTSITITIVSAGTPPLAPANVMASKATYLDKVVVSWDAVPNATRYEVWRANNNDSNEATLISGYSFTNTSFEDTTAETNRTYYYWVKAVNNAGSSPFSDVAFGYRAGVGPYVFVNSRIGEVDVCSTDSVAIAVQMMNMSQYLGVPIDWWFIVRSRANNMWFYLDNQLQWRNFSGNLLECRPAYQGGLMNTPQIIIAAFQSLPQGTYDLWFVVDYPMDGILNLSGPMLYNQAVLVVH